MNTINIKLKNKIKYSILIEYNLLNTIKDFYPIRCKDNVILITNYFLKNKYSEYLYNKINNFNVNFKEILIPDGESSKCFDIVNLIITELLSNNCNRNSILIAFGGGVIGDITGFVASIYQRGIKFIQIPTTLLSQIDSSIGGKTGINHNLGKNMIGTFYQPSSVFIDLFFLNTLPKKEISSGLAEVIKYSIILDMKFFIWLESNIENIINLEINSIKYCVYKCCKLKSDIVRKDEKESKLRSILNLGHTFGHAIESFMGYGKWTHGESIAVGILMSVEVATYINDFKKEYKDRIRNLILKSGLPVKGPKIMKPKDYINYMKRDKKNVNNNIRLIIPKYIGKVEFIDNISEDILIKSIENVNNH